MPTEWGYFHLYNRGCNRDLIFFKDEHYRLLLKKIKDNYQRFNLRMITYCLMPNHYHLMIGAPIEDPSEGRVKNLSLNKNFFLRPSEGSFDCSVTISKFIQRTFNGYVQAVNFEMQRKGTLFESRYKSIYIGKEEYLLQLVRYIHVNPVLAGLCVNPEDWEFSNCQEWLGLRKGTLFDQDFFETYFQTLEQYRDFLHAYKEDKLMQKEMRQLDFD